MTILWIHLKCVGTYNLCVPPFQKHSSDAYLQNHFVPGTSGSKKHLKSGAVPSVFQWTQKTSKSAEGRAKRARKREFRNVEGLLNEATNGANSELEGCESVGAECEIADSAELGDVSDNVYQDVSPVFVSCATQTEGSGAESGSKVKLSIESVGDKPAQLAALTGLKDYDYFKLVLDIINPSSELIEGRCLSVEDQLLLVLMKLRLNDPDAVLAVHFDVSRQAVSKIINKWLIFMFERFSAINIWPDRDVIPKGEPVVIIDCTECSIQVPLNPVQQQGSYSTYKKSNTVKVLIGISWNGAIVFCSEAYGGSTSDREAFIKCGIMEKLRPGDIVLADRGFQVQDLLALKDVKLVTPAFLKGKTQLNSGAVLASRRITRKRIHVERLIGLTKCFKILREPLHRHRVQLASQIVYVCAFMCNLKPAVV